MCGSALMVTLLLTATLTILGLGFLTMADTELVISSSGRDSEQLLHTAESGVRMVKAWFDQPVTGNPALSSQVLHKFLATYDLRNPALFDRTKRLFDHDGDPNTPMVLSDGTAARPFYRQGRTLWAPSAYLDLFHKPYRGDALTEFRGTAAGPDILIADNPAGVDFLDKLNQALFSDQARTGRITEIAIYAPPEIPVGSAMKRAGICTIRVTVAKFRRMGVIGVVPVVTPTSVKVAERSIEAVLNEVPGALADGPLESCGTLSVTGALRAHWGKVIASGDVTLASDLDLGVPSAFPYKTFSRRLNGTGPGDDFIVWSSNADDTIEDPWLKVMTAGSLVGAASSADQPYAFSQATAVDADHSNLFQHEAGVGCAAFRYGVMKAAAASGDETARYFAWDPGTGLFREGGIGAAKSVYAWTHNQEGLFFFDTRDGEAPNGHGPGDALTNLTPPVVIENVDWNFSGLLYLDAESIRMSNVVGANRVVIPPGEPFDDANANGSWDAGESYVNLSYPTTILSSSPGSVFTRSAAAAQSASATSPDLESYTFATTVGRDRQGIPITGQVSLFGVLYNAGNVVAEGTARHYGSLIAGTAVVQETPGADSAEIFFDQRLNTGEWPPAEIAFPRTHLTRWSAGL